MTLLNTQMLKFSEVGKQTEMFARFSTVSGERGAADLERGYTWICVEILYRGR